MSDVAVTSPRSTARVTRRRTSVDLADGIRIPYRRADRDLEVPGMRCPRRHEDVGRLDVAVNNARAGRREQRAAE